MIRTVLDNQLYREVQVFALLCNEAFENYVWGITQFCGGAGLIPLFYGLFTLHGKMGAWMMAGWLLLTVTSVNYSVLFFHVGSQPVKLSGKFLHLAEKSSRRKCAWSRKFFRSCTIIVMKIGGFHILDRRRGPDLFRFVLLRTDFLVTRWHSNSQLELGF